MDDPDDIADSIVCGDCQEKCDGCPGEEIRRGLTDLIVILFDDLEDTLDEFLEDPDE